MNHVLIFFAPFVVLIVAIIVSFWVAFKDETVSKKE